MKKENKAQNSELSLLENPNSETQVKENFVKVTLRVIIITLLFVLIIFGYSIKFSASSFSGLFGNKFTGTFNASNFYDANNYDLIVTKPYQEIYDVKKGDIVCYATNLEKGSGKIVGEQGTVFEIEINGELKRVSKNSIIGKQTKTIPVLGMFVEFIGSYYGIVTFNVILIAYVLYLTFSRINYENTAKGLYLYKKFRLDQKEEKKRLKLLKKLNGTENVELEIVNILSGSYEQNLENLINFKSQEKIDLKDKYKHILNVIHDSYLPKTNLTRDEKSLITSLVELMCVANDVDNDIEYMVIDLVLKTGVSNFDTKNFNKQAVEFLSSHLDDDDLLNFGSILYVLIYKNKKVRKDLKETVDLFLQKAQYSDKKDRDAIFKVALSLVNMIKS